MFLKIAAAYIRVSDERQDEYSPDSQLKLIRQYAEKNGYTIPENYVFYDDGISGKSTNKRLQFNEMIALAKEKNKPFEAIFVWKFSRFARNQEESIVYKSLLKKNGVSVVSISEPIIDGAFGTLIERIIEWMDEYYLINLSVEVKRGMLEKATRGEPMCAPAYGYDLLEKNYVPNEYAENVREIFNLFVGGMGINTIAKRMASKGMVTTRKNKPDNRYIEYILNNPVYIGKIRWSADGRCASKRDYDNPNIIVVDGTHEPIISLEIWEKAQEILKQRKEKKVPYQRRDQAVEWMLKGIIRCGNCGASLVMSGKNQDRLQCHRYSHSLCEVSHSVSIELVNKVFIETLENCINSLTFTVRAPQIQTNNSHDSEVKKLIEAEEKKLKRIRESYENGIDTIEEYKQSKMAITKRIGALKAELGKSGAVKEFSAKDYALNVKKVIDFVSDDTNSEKAKNDMIKSIVEKVVFNKVQKTLDIYFWG